MQPRANRPAADRLRSTTTQPLRSRGLTPTGGTPRPAPRGAPPARPGGTLVATADGGLAPPSGVHPTRARPSSPAGGRTRHRKRKRRGHYAGPFAILLVGGVVAGTIISGGGAAAAHRANAQRLAAEVDQPTVVLAGPDMAMAHDLVLSVVDATKRPGHGVASRSLQRTPLHEWVRPASGVLTSPFGIRWGRLHAGIDLAGPYGAPIRAATDGCITYAGPESGYGEVMKISDWDGTETVYGHMEAFVRTHGCVHAGELIARIGAEGDATGPHLHFEVRIAGVPIDPTPFLERRGVRV